MPSPKQTLIAVIGTVLLAAMPSLSTPAFADDGAASAAMKSDMMRWIKDAETKLVDISDAVPESKYSWRPGKGVRSVGEVYMHVAAANYGIPSFFGVQPPAGFDFATYEKSLTKKDDIRKALEDSFAHMEQALTDASDADMEKPVELFGMKMTERGAFFLLLSHVHEHLGQSIAYARTNGVVPPWTARQEQAAKDGEAKKKSETK